MPQKVVSSKNSYHQRQFKISNRSNMRALTIHAGREGTRYVICMKAYEIHLKFKICNRPLSSHMYTL